MVGGERAGDSALRQELCERRQKAEDRRELLRRANRSLEDEDGIIEGIFNSLTGQNTDLHSAVEKFMVGIVVAG